MDMQISEVSIMTIEQLKKRKEELGFTYEQIAMLSGVPIGTVQKVLGGITVSPRYDTLMALEKVLGEDISGNMVSEESAVYGSKKGATSHKNPGEYTVEDYYALPDDRRAELIDGVFYDMSSPTTVHQMIALDISLQFKSYISSNKGSCIPFTAPCDVQLDKDDKTIVQPDVMIVCDKDKINKNKIYGAPDLIVEILSPSTSKKDMSTKLAKYSNAGVREYWLVDPDKQKIVVYDFTTDTYDIAIYGFDDKVPVAIYNGKCKVNFKAIYNDIAFLL